MTTKRIYHVGLFAALAVLAVAFFAFPALASAQATGTVDFVIEKKFSGPYPEGYTASQFTFTVNGDGFPSTEVPLTHETDDYAVGSIELGAGTYTVTEDGPEGFVPEDWTIQWSGAGCENKNGPDLFTTITVEENDLGLENFGCRADNQFFGEIEDEEEPATLTIEKEVVGTSTSPDNFSFSVNGGTTTAFESDGDNELVMATGTYSVVEVDTPEGFAVTLENCTDIELGPGDSATCTITNEWIEEQLSCEPGVELLANGDFESPEVTDGAGWDIFDLSTFPALGWVVDFAGSFAGAPDEASLELHSSVNGWSHASGDQHAELDSDWQGPEGTPGEESSVIISQEVPTVPGETYTLSWEFSPRPDTPEGDNILEVLVDGSVQVTQQASGSGLTDTSWESGSIEFDADDEDVTVAFRDAGTPNSLGTLLDNASLICGTTTDDGGDGGDGGDGDDGAVIIVDKVTSPGGSDQSFEFNASWLETNFNLADGDAPFNSGDLSSELGTGTFSVQEVNIPEGWTLSNVACVSSLGDDESADNIDLNEDETVTCTFTNTAEVSDTGDGGGRPGGGGGSRPPVCELFESDTDGDTMTLRWETRYGGDLSITKDGEEIYFTTDSDEADEGSVETDADADASFELKVWRGTRSDTCTIGDSDGGSSGSGGDDPEGQVLGEQVSLVPYGAADAGAGGAVATTLPQSLALLMALASIFGLRATRD